MEKLKILIIDDVPSMRRFAKFSLEKIFTGAAVEEVASGREAKAKMDQVKYDLIICDGEMPDMSGAEVLNWIRSHPTLSGTPFVMVSSQNDKQSVMKAIESGANSYVVKPYTAEMLAQKIIAVMDKFDRRQSRRLVAGGTVKFQFRDFVAQGSIIDISQSGMLCKLSRKDHIPPIFEKAILDLKLEDESSYEGINAFVIRIQAAEDSIDSAYVKLAFKFMELSDSKQSELAMLLSTVKKTVLNGAVK